MTQTPTSSLPPIATPNLKPSSPLSSRFNVTAAAENVIREELKRRARERQGQTQEYDFRGAALQFQTLQAPEVIIEGPSETGKTLSILNRIHRLATETKNLQALIVRKQLTDTYSSVLQTFQNKILRPGGVNVYGGERPQWYDYDSGARIWIGGLDKSGKVLSSEYDIVYVNQAEELTLEDWETLTTRTTGRAGNLKSWSMTCGDCNPRGSKHWILERAKAGRLQLLHSVHRDNPALFDDAGNLTEQGKRTFATLENLTGMRRQRLLEGKWATPEGCVYDNFSIDVNVQHRDPSEFQYWIMGMDEGYVHPAVILQIGIDSDIRLHVFREFYERGKVQSAIVEAAVAMCRQHRPVVVCVDSSAAGLIADLLNAGLPAESHKGRVLDGIAIIQDLLKVQGDGKPRLTVAPGCTNTINEFESYVWRMGKDEPVKDNDHALDAIRYSCDWLFASDEPRREVVYRPERIGQEY